MFEVSWSTEIEAVVNGLIEKKLKKNERIVSQLMS